MNRRKPVVLSLSLALLVSICCVVITSQQALAVSQEDLTTKAMAAGLYTCYAGGTYTKEEITTDTRSTVDVLFTDAGRNTRNIYLPFRSQPVSCEELLTGTNTSSRLTGLLGRYGKGGDTFNPENYGYEKVAGTSDGSARSCVSLHYRYRDSNNTIQEATTNGICVARDQRGAIDIKSLSYEGSQTEPVYLAYSCGVNCSIYAYDKSGAMIANASIGGVGGNVSWDEFKGKFNASSSGALDEFGNTYTEMSPIYAIDTNNNSPGATYRKKTRIAATNEALSYLTNGAITSRSDVGFSDQERLDIYSSYINSALNESNSALSVDMNKCWESKSEVPSDTYAYPTSSNGWCELVGVDSVTGSYAIFSNAYSLKNGSFKDVVDQLMTLSTSDATPPSFNPGTGNINSGIGTGGGSGGSTNGAGGNGGDDGLSVCAGSSKSLSWILCPVIEFTARAIESIYENVINNQLMIDPGLLEAGDGSGTYSAWSVFRNAANIAFIIAFAVVILSQVTGIGISNYGIKKTLPRLIVVAILTNLSFILCQLVVDVSNILGAAFYNLFVNLASDVEGVRFAGDIAGEIATLLTAGAAAGGIALAGGPAAAALTIIGFLPGIVITLVLTIIGILFFFILLGVRQAAVVILVALAPLAIICYALPNTKSLFDRWKKAFTALLLLFPICGLMMGGGIFASQTLLANDKESLLFNLIAMSLQVVPFFFIPTLLRRSLSSLGDIGTRLTNFSNRARAGLGKRVRNTEAFEDVERRARAFSASRQLRSLDRRRRNGQSLSRREQTRRLRLAEAVERNASRRALEVASQDHAPLQEGTDGFDRRVANLRAREDRERMEALQDSFNQMELAGNFTSTQQENQLSEYLRALRENPEDQDAYLGAAALIDKMTKSDPGLAGIMAATRKELESAGDDPRALQGLKKLSNFTLGAHDGIYKNKHRSLRSLFKDIAGNNLDQHDVRTGGALNRYNAAGIDGYNAAQFAGASEDQYKRIGARVQELGLKLGDGRTDMTNRLAGVMAGTDGDYTYDSNTGTIVRNSDGATMLDEEETGVLQQFEQLSTGALTNPNISVQITARDHINDIRSNLGYDRLEYNSSRGTDDASLQIRGAGAGEFGLPTIESLQGLSEYTDSRGVRHTVGTDTDGRRIDTFKEGGRTIERTVDPGGAITERILNASGQEVATATITRDGKITYTSGGNLYGGSTGALTRSGERLSGQEATDYRLRAARDGHEQAELWLQNERRQHNGGGNGGIIA